MTTATKDRREPMRAERALIDQSRRLNPWLLRPSCARRERDTILTSADSLSPGIEITQAPAIRGRGPGDRVARDPEFKFHRNLARIHC